MNTKIPETYPPRVESVSIHNQIIWNAEFVNLSLKVNLNNWMDAAVLIETRSNTVVFESFGVNRLLEAIVEHFPLQ